MIDKSNMYKELENFSKQIEKGYKLGENIEFHDTIDHILIVGMGGSALAAGILASYLDIDVPIRVVKNYNLPKHTNKKTLLIAISYSGNTEETISCFRQGMRIGCPTLVMAHGGKLKELAEMQKVEFIQLPKAVQPRCDYGYQFFALLRVIENMGLIEKQESHVKKTAELLESDVYKDYAKKVIDKLDKKIPIIYSSEKNKAIAYKWKISFNENAKIHAFYNVFPELDHNELVGYTHMFADFATIIIRDDEDHPRIKKRMDVTKKLIKENDCNVIEIAVKGSSRMAKLFSAIYIGDWVSYFLALEYETDPSPVDIVERLKKEMV